MDTSPSAFEDFLNEESVAAGDFSKDWTPNKIIGWQYVPAVESNYVEKHYATADAFSLAYIPPALGIIFARIIAHIVGVVPTPIGLMFYCARLFTLIFSVFIIRYAIKRTPIFKRTIALVALVPMTLFICSMISYDNIIIAFSLLYFSVFFDLLLSKKPIDSKDVILLIISGIFLVNVKLMYAAFLIFLLFIPKEAFSHNKKIRYLLLIFVGIALATFLYKIPILINGTTVAGMTETVESQQQLNWVIHNPFGYVVIFAKNIFKQRSYYINSTVGLLGNADAFNPLLINLLVYIMLVVVAILEGKTDKGHLKLNMKITNVLCCLFCILTIFTALYIGFTAPQLHEIGGDSIIGVQGRYFAPLLFPLLALFSSRNKNHQTNKTFINAGCFFCCFLVLVISAVTLLIRYWS